MHSQKAVYPQCRDQPEHEVRKHADTLAIQGSKHRPVRLSNELDQQNLIAVFISIHPAEDHRSCPHAQFLFQA